MITYQSFRRNLLVHKKPPRYIYTHYPRKYEKEYTKWLKAKPKCYCGCKTVLNIKYDTFARYFRSFGKPPVFYRDHTITEPKSKKEKIENRKEPLPKEKLNELCEIIEADHGRCIGYKECPNFLSNKCLDKCIKNKWSGWRSAK